MMGFRRIASMGAVHAPHAARLAALLCTVYPLLAAGQQANEPEHRSSISELRERFVHPPDDCRIMMRWWWFGPSATDQELKRELEQMKEAGIGGVEIATLYPLALDDPATGFHNYDFVSDEHVEHLRFAADEARRLGLRVDVTLGSGWPFGGPHIPVTEAAGGLRVEAVPLAEGTASVTVPALEAGEKLMAAFIAPAQGASPDMKQARPLPMPTGARVEVPNHSANDRRVLFFISSRTGMMVKRPAAGTAGFVLDHYDSAAIANHLHAVGDRLLSAFGDHPPYAVFSDSLEDYASDWTPDLLAEFQRRRGYDLTPLLPALVSDFGPDTAAVRHDWGQTLTELANERFLQPIHEWARQHHTLFRSQTYGFPPVTLSSNRYEDLPEGEGKASVNMWRRFSDTRWAASAGHLFGHNVTSSETWTWLHSPAFRATPLDMKAEADLHFLQGINQLVGHGWPYSPEAAGEPGWRMYAAGAFDAHNPWFNVMPDVTAYLQRVSCAMRLGRPANDVALLLPNDDVWSSFAAKVRKPRPPTSALGFDESGSNVSMDEDMPLFLNAEVIPQILDAGFNIDFIDADAINAVGIPYKVLVLPGVDRLPPEIYEKIVDFAQHGGIVIATRRLPGTAPGLSRAAEISSRIQKLSETLFHGQIATAHFVADEHDLGAQLKQWLRPDFVTTPAIPEIGFIHRRLDTGDLYFIANTSNRRQTFQATFRSQHRRAQEWDPFTGNARGIANPDRVDFDLQPYESRIVVFADEGLSPAPQQTQVNVKDISHDWSVSFEGQEQVAEWKELVSWTDDPKRRYYSGTVTYVKSFEVAPAELWPLRSVAIDFGEGTPVPFPTTPVEFNTRAYLDAPVREAAKVIVNGQLAGYIWHPPFRVDVTQLLKPGKNDLRILVGNTAINELAGASLPNYRLLYSRYGKLFEPQGMNNLEPLPSGILGPVTLIESSTAH
jgi:alpha-L-rhamnosidase